MLVVGGVDIGNRLDTSPRIISAISTFQVIITENIRAFNSFCNDLNIHPSAKIIEYSVPMDQKQEQKILDEILDILKVGTDVLLLSDDGMPVVADPGGLIVDMAHRNGHRVSVIPGPSIVSTLPAIIAAGGSKRFTFEDELPSDRSDRLRMLQKLYSEGRGVVFIIKNRRDDNAWFKEILRDIKLVFPLNNLIGFGINLTMPNEMIIRTSIADIDNAFIDYNFSPKDFISVYLDCR